MGDQSAFIALFENSGLLDGRRVDSKRVRALSAGTLSDIAEQAAVIGDPVALRPPPGTLSHSASLSLGGGAETCAYVGCRQDRIDQLAQFAAFYSDRVYVRDFVSAHQVADCDSSEASLESRRLWMLDDLEVIARVAPLIDAGIIVPVAPAAKYCPSCLAAKTFGDGADIRFDKVEAEVQSRYLKETTVSLTRDEFSWNVIIEGPEDLIAHTATIHPFETPPDPLVRRPSLLKRAQAGEKVTLSATLRKELGMHEHLADLALGSVVFEMTVAQSLGCAYLNDSELHVSILAALSGDGMRRRNDMVRQHLTSLVPFLEGLPADAILRLRQEEGDSFLTFRAALNSAIGTIRDEGVDLTAKDARGIYSDVLQPGLARVDRTLSGAKRALARDVGKSLVGWTAAIAFGMYSGFLPAELVEVAKAVGLTGALANLIGTGLNAMSQTDQLRGDDLYFLWRLREASS